MTRKELAVYIATIRGVIGLIESLKKPTAKKICALLEAEIAAMRAEAEKEFKDGE